MRVVIVLPFRTNLSSRSITSGSKVCDLPCTRTWRVAVSIAAVLDICNRDGGRPDRVSRIACRRLWIASISVTTCAAQSVLGCDVTQGGIIKEFSESTSFDGINGLSGIAAAGDAFGVEDVGDLLLRADGVAVTGEAPAAEKVCDFFLRADGECLHGVLTVVDRARQGCLRVSRGGPESTVLDLGRKLEPCRWLYSWPLSVPRETTM